MRSCSSTSRQARFIKNWSQEKLAETHILKSLSILKSLGEEYLIEYSLILDHLTDFFVLK